MRLAGMPGAVPGRSLGGGDKTMNVMTSEEFREALMERMLIMPNGCWELGKHHYYGDGPRGGSYPVVFEGRRRVNLRRVCYNWVPGRPPLGERIVVCTCGNPRCLNPKHLARGNRPRSKGPHGTNRGKKLLRYPWADWFRRKGFVLTPDYYEGDSKTMAQQIRNNAPLHGVKVSIIREGPDLENLRVIVFRRK